MSSPVHQNSSFSTPQWWKEAVVYQIYPSSFQSHSGATTGWGSIQGIASRLDYLKSLGVDVVWSSPICKSPQADMGYDIADYKQIYHRYGTLQDVDNLIAELTKRGMKLMMDLVVNHTSNEHAWFLESRSSKDSPKRDWYIWKKPKSVSADGVPEPPSNWAQILGEANSAWTYDEKTGEYYLSLFTPEQPDLNWENPEVRAAVWDVMHFWLQRGAAGFRMDVINLISKVPGYPDAEVVLGAGCKFQPAFKYFVNGPKMHDYLQEMHREVLSKYDTITVGEMPGISDDDEVLRTVGAKAGELRMIFIFDLVDIDKPHVRMALKPWDVKEMKSIISRWQRVMIEKDGWNSVFIENHDNPRSVSRYVDDSDEWRHIGAKLIALMQTTLGGTLFIYQGEEIGLRNISKSWDIEEFKDIETINYWAKVNDLYADNPEELAYGRKIIDMKARDHSRTPMHWNAEENAGFCDAGAKPWMRIMDDYKTVNVDAQMKADLGDDLSVWQFWQRGLKDRKEHADVFVYGDFEELSVEHPNVFAYVRTSIKGEKWLVVLNYSGQELEWLMPDNLSVQFWACSNYVKGRAEKPLKKTIPLKPWEGILGRGVECVEYDDAKFAKADSFGYDKLSKPQSRPTTEISDVKFWLVTGDVKPPLKEIKYEAPSQSWGVGSPVYFLLIREGDLKRCKKDFQ
ncbi:glycoside hydrolase superfamily [Pseudomassariella vexata]|uniref:Glycoside hydrolase superfamily n=1 Tax=Pseudomassariella vexata TaxID=1141098 RepID=A0A1Y2DK51_9PEZI|nr:glycoside hydrolase superfamily [Pseudomassariella vexata]ORY59647.1 glycoside hydrolase superfamily [Pseudomassariella vexata]